MRLLIPALLTIILSSCVTKSDLAPIHNDIRIMKYQLKTQTYFNETTNCFVALNYCVHQSIDPEFRKECVNKHEACVITVYNKYEKLLNAK